jgi:hypothetical protein
MRCYCCARWNDPFICTCDRETCRRYLLCTAHCRCMVKPLEPTKDRRPAHQLSPTTYSEPSATCT